MNTISGREIVPVASVTVAIDAHGGDHAPGIVIKGIQQARIRHPGIRYKVFGDEARIAPLIAAEPGLAAVCTIIHTPDAVAMDAKPSVAVRTGRRSSMRLAIDCVAEGQADCVVSAGNTGALMAMAMFSLKTLRGIDRPAIASFFPTLRGETVMLDLGANVVCQSDNLVQFALMGAIFSKTLLGIAEPTIGVLNIGAEDVKGNEVVKAAAATLRTMPLPGKFHGFVEGNDISFGTVDVVVTDGFTGNVALKTAEGMAKFYAELLKRSFRSSWLAKIGYLFMRPALLNLKQRTDPRKYNGAMFLGLQGVCVKSHGGTDEIGFANAVGVAADLAIHRFNDKISAEMIRLAETAALGDPSSDAESLPPE